MLGPAKSRFSSSAVIFSSLELLRAVDTRSVEPPLYIVHAALFAQVYQAAGSSYKVILRPPYLVAHALNGVNASRTPASGGAVRCSFHVVQRPDKRQSLKFLLIYKNK
jgi:hypothetical protein